MSWVSVVGGHGAGAAEDGEAVTRVAASSPAATAPPSAPPRATPRARPTGRVTGPSHHSAKSPARTVATPSSVLAGPRWSAASTTVWWAFATAYDAPAQVSI